MLTACTAQSVVDLFAHRLGVGIALLIKDDEIIAHTADAKIFEKGDQLR